MSWRPWEKSMFHYLTWMPCSFGNSQIVCSHACIRLLTTVYLSEGPKKKLTYFRSTRVSQEKWTRSHSFSHSAFPTSPGLPSTSTRPTRKRFAHFRFINVLRDIFRFSLPGHREVPVRAVQPCWGGGGVHGTLPGHLPHLFLPSGDQSREESCQGYPEGIMCFSETESLVSV